MIRKLIYIIFATYLFLLIMMNIGVDGPDLIFIFFFFVAYNESINFSVIYGFYLGLLTGLLDPQRLGLFSLIYALLPIPIQFLKVRFYQNILSMLLIFIAIFIVKVLIVGLGAGFMRFFSFWYYFNSIIFFLPLFLISNYIVYNSWMKRI